MELIITLFINFEFGAGIILALYFLAVSKKLKCSSKLNFDLFNTYVFKIKQFKIFSFSFSKFSPLLFVSEKISCG